MVCNTGVSLIPELDGRWLHFTNAGLYDGLFVMQDRRTLTLWNHITGEAMYGEHAGRSLEISGALRPMTVAQALELDPGMRIAISGRPFANSGPGFTPTSFGRGGLGEPPPPDSGGGGGGPAGARGLPDPDARMGDMFVETLGEEDTRRERMEMGLGVWDADGLRRFYPFEGIRRRGAFVDTVGGRNLLVYRDPGTSVPAALYVDAAGAAIEGRQVRLENGQSIVAGRLIDADGGAVPMERPNQVFTRWYGFSLTFPNPEVFEE